MEGYERYHLRKRRESHFNSRAVGRGAPSGPDVLPEPALLGVGRRYLIVTPPHLEDPESAVPVTEIRQGYQRPVASRLEFLRSLGNGGIMTALS